MSSLKTTFNEKVFNPPPKNDNNNNNKTKNKKKQNKKKKQKSNKKNRRGQPKRLRWRINVRALRQEARLSQKSELSNQTQNAPLYIRFYA